MKKTLSHIFPISFSMLLIFAFQINAQNCSNLNPSFTISLNNGGCGTNSTASFTNTSTGSATSASTFYWYCNGVVFDTTSGTTSPNSITKGSGTYVVALVSKTSGGCRDTVRQPFTVTPKPNASFSGLADTICLNSTAYFSSTSTNTVTSTYYNWSFGDGNSVSNYSDTVSHTYGSSGQYTVQLTVVNQSGCTDVATKKITITSGRQALRFYDGNGQPQHTVTWSRCINIVSQPDSFSQVFASPDTIYNYTISFGDGTSESGDTLLPYPKGFSQHTYQNTGVFDFIVISNPPGGCKLIFQGKVVNLRVPTVGVGGPKNGIQSGCVPMTTSFYNSSSNASGHTSFTWDFGDGTTATYDTSNISDSVYHSYYTSLCNIYITLTATNECGSTQSTWGPINAYTLDNADISGTASLCYPDTSTTLSVATNYNCYSGTRYYYWDFGDGINTGWSTFPLPQTHNFPDTGTYEVVLIDSNICGIDSARLNVDIWLPPVADFKADTVCEGDFTNFTDLSSIAGGNGNIISWTWNFGDGHTSSDQNPTHKYSSYGSYNVRLVVESAHNCFDIISKTIYVKETPAASISTNPGPNVCNLKLIQFSASYTLNTSSVADWYWNFGDGDTAHAQNTSHTYLNNGTYPVKFFITAANGCSSYDSSGLNIYASPIADFNSDSICFGDYTNFKDKSTTVNGEKIKKYRWDFDSDGSIDKTSKNPSFKFPSFGTFSITHIVITEYGCVDTIVKTSDVHQNPIPGFNYSASTICQNDSIFFKNTSTIADSFIWNFKDGSTYNTRKKDSFYHVFNSAGTYFVSLMAHNYHGCYAGDSLTITINPAPTSSYNTDKTSGCEPLQVKFTNTTPSADHYFWDFGNGITSTTNDTTITYTRTTYSDSTYYVKLIAEKSGCYDTFLNLIDVYHKPQAMFTLLPDSGCSPLKVNVNNQTHGADSFYWSCTSGDTSTSQNPKFAFGNYLFQDINYDLTLYAVTTHNCSDTTKNPIKVKPAPFALFGSDRIQGCHPLSVSFTNYSIIADSFLWDFGDGETSISKNPSHAFDGTSVDTSYTVQLIIINKNGCKDTFSSKILVYKKVKAYFNEHDTACLPLIHTFTDSSTNASYWKWEFGDGSSSTSANVSHTYTTAGTYSVKLAISNQSGCSDTMRLNNIIKVNQTPSANFSINKVVGCEPLLVNITNLSVNADSSLWEFGDNQSLWTSSSNLQHSYYTPSQDTIYTLKLRVQTNDGCFDSIDKKITTYKGVTARFNDTAAGCTPLNVQFYDSSSNALFWIWDFGDGALSTSQNPQHNYTLDGIYNVQLIASNLRCSDTTTLYQNVKVYPKPSSFFTLSKTNGCEPLQVHFTNQSNLADTIIWYFGDGDTSSSNNPVHNFTTWANDTIYTICLKNITKYGCRDSFERSINVYKSVQAYFNESDSGCVPKTIRFIDSSSFASYWNWDFGDGNSSSLQHPTYIYTSPGTYTTTLIASNQRCSDTFVMKQNIKTFDNPTAFFTNDKNSGCEPLDISFDNQSQLADSIVWHFGEGSFGYTSKPTFTYTTPNRDTIYQAKLLAITRHGCIDSFSKSISVYKAVNAHFNEVDSGCVPLKVQFNDSSSYANFWLWDFGDGNTSTVQNPNYTYYNPGTYNVRLIASNFRCSDTITLQNNINTFENPVALFSADIISGCEPLDVSFTNLSYLAKKTEWYFGDGSNSLNSDPVHQFQTLNNDTTYSAKLVVKTFHGCADSFTKNISVFESVKAFYDISDSGCAPLTVNFRDSSASALFWLWNFNDGNASTKPDPTYTFHNPGTYSVSLIASNNHCSDTFEKKNNVIVWKVPVANFFSNQDTVIMPNTTFHFTSLSDNKLKHYWNFDDQKNSTNINPSHSYADSGFYNVSLIVSTQHCSDTAWRKVRVVPPLPQPGFSFYPNNGCLPLEVHFTDESQYAQSYIWSFGDGGTSRDKNPVYTYRVPGTFTVTLITSNDIGTTNIRKSNVITVYPKPTTYFEVTPEVAFLPNAIVKLVNRTSGATSYQWFIDNGFFSEESDPVATFNYPGKHTVSLISTSIHGCKDTLIRDNIIQIDSQSNIEVPSAFTPANYDGLNDGFKPKGFGFSEEGYLFIIFNRWGEKIFETTDINASWDGTFNGKMCENEVYYWILQVDLYSSGRKKIDGKVHLLR